MKRIALFLFLIFSVIACFAQTQIDPTYQIQWNLLSGSGAPTISCTQNGNYTVYPYGAEWGQSYQDTTNNIEYKCTVSGWVKNLPANGCTTSVGGNLFCNSSNYILLADQFDGADCGAKINSAVGTTGSIPHIIQVGPSCGYTVSTQINLGINHLSFITGGTWTFSAPIVMGHVDSHSSSIYGLPVASNGAPVTLKIASGYTQTCPADEAGTSYYGLICTSSGVTIHDLLIDGNKANQTQPVQNILVQNANRVHIYNVTAQNAAQDNIHVTSTMYPAVQPSTTYATGDILTCNNGAVYRVQVKTPGGTSGTTYPVCSQTVGGESGTWGSVVLTTLGSIHDGSSGSGYLGPDVLTQSAGRDGFFMERNADWIIGLQVEFESNGRDGFHCEDCATSRFSNCDFGANQRYGFYAAVVNSQCASGMATGGHIIKGSQFGTNAKSGTGGDIFIDGSAITYPNFCTVTGGASIAGANTIVGNSFIGLGVVSTTVDSITLSDSSANTVVGNTWGLLPWAARFNYLVNSSFTKLTGVSEKGQTIRANSLAPAAASPPSFTIYQAATPFNLTSGIDIADAMATNGVIDGWYNLKLHGNLITDGTSSFAGNVTIANNIHLNFTDTLGGSPHFVCQTDDQCLFYGTWSDGTQHAVAGYSVGSAAGMTAQAFNAFNGFAVGSNKGINVAACTGALLGTTHFGGIITTAGSCVTDFAQKGTAQVWTASQILANGLGWGWTSPAGHTYASVSQTDGNHVQYTPNSAGTLYSVFSFGTDIDVGSNSFRFSIPVKLPGSLLAAAISSTTPTVGAGVCWKTATTLGTCTAGTWPNCTTCN